MSALSKAWVCGRWLGLRVRITPDAWMSVSCECCVLSGRGLCVRLITCPEETCRAWGVWVWFRNLENEEALTHYGLSNHGGGDLWILLFHSTSKTITFASSFASSVSICTQKSAELKINNFTNDCYNFLLNFQYYRFSVTGIVQLEHQSFSWTLCLYFSICITVLCI